MKYGRSLQELAVEIERQRDSKKDYIVDTDIISMKNEPSGLSLDVEGINGGLGITDTAHSQIGTYLDIPSRYYRRMRAESPELLAHNVNHWLHTSTDNSERRMLRTLDGNARAFLSNRYRRIDNEQIAETVLPIILQMDGASVESCEITETKMYIKVVNPRIQAQVTVGDIVQAGISISNSEVGCGSVMVSPLIYRLVCSNGMIAQDGQIPHVRSPSTTQKQLKYRRQPSRERAQLKKHSFSALWSGGRRNALTAESTARSHSIRSVSRKKKAVSATKRPTRSRRCIMCVRCAAPSHPRRK